MVKMIYWCLYQETEWERDYSHTTISRGLQQETEASWNGSTEMEKCCQGEVNQALGASVSTPNIQMTGSELGVYMKAWILPALVSKAQAGDGGVKLYWMFSWHTLASFLFYKYHSLPVYYCWPYHPFMTSGYPSSNVPCNKNKIISNWFLKYEFMILKWPLQWPDLSP